MSDRTAVQRVTLIAATLGLGITILDETVVFLALPAIDRDLGIGLGGQQWVVNAYLLPLAALLLVAGSLADRIGRRRTFVIGLVGFGFASALAGLAPTGLVLLSARAVQGIFAALLMPATLALLTAAFQGRARGEAIGSWAAWSGASAAVGPLVAGVLIATVSWRGVFFLSVPIVAVALALSPHIEESRDEGAGRLDLTGALLAAVALGSASYAVVQGPAVGWTDVRVLAAGIVAVPALVAFFAWERHTATPMLPLELFRSRPLRAANTSTLALYAVFNGNFFLLTIYLQMTLGYSALAAGAATLPVTLLMLGLSARVGRWAQWTGARAPMVAGQVLVAGGVLLLSFLRPGDGYALHVLPGVVAFGVGLALTVAPMTDTAVSAVDDARAGLASGVNDAAARLAALIGVAGIGVVFAVVFRAGLDLGPAAAAAADRAGQQPTSALSLNLPPEVRDQVRAATATGYAAAMQAGAAVAVLGALAAVGVPGRPERRGTARQVRSPRPAVPPSSASGSAPAGRGLRPQPERP